MVDGRIQPVNDAYRNDAVEIFGRPVGLGGRFGCRDNGACRLVAPYGAAGIAQRAGNGRQKIGGNGPVDKDGLGRAADPGAPHLGVDGYGHRFRGVGRRIDEKMADPLKMREDRHTGLGLHALHQRAAATRNDDVDLAGRGEHRADGTAIIRRDHLHGVTWQPCRRQTVGHQLGKESRRLAAVGSAAKDGGIAGDQAQAAGVDGHIRA